MPYSAVVVGGGVVGYSTALALQRCGEETVLLEQFPTPHTRGSSVGQSRITRVANYGAKEINPLMLASFQDWKRLERQSKTKLLVPTPMLIACRGETAEKMKTSIRAAGSEPIFHTAEELKRKYGYNFPPDEETFSDPAAGVLLADQCVLAIKRLYEACGGIVLDQWQVKDVFPDESGGVVVHGSDGTTVTARRAVICAGPWTSSLLQKLGLNLPLRPIKVGVYYWKLKNPNDNVPICIIEDDCVPRNHYYGTPSIEYPGLVKLCVHSGEPCDPDKRDATDISLHYKKCQELVRKRLPFLEPEAAIIESCMYTMTPDEVFILDTVPGCSNIAYACGFSGTGFKTAPVVGRLLCQLVTGQKLDHDISRFAAGRFNTSKY